MGKQNIFHHTNRTIHTLYLDMMIKKKTVGLFINPNSYDVELKTYRYEEIIDQGKIIMM